MPFGVLAFLIVSLSLCNADSSCVNPVFTDAAAWDTSIDGNITFPPAPVPFVPVDRLNNLSSPVCSYFASQDVCCPADALYVIESSLAEGTSKLRVAESRINNEEFFTQMINLLSVFFPNPNTTVVADIAELNNTIRALRESQKNCVASLSGYMEGMLCFACVVNSTLYINEDLRQISIAEGTCSGIVSECGPVNTAALAVLSQALKVVSQFLPGLEHDVITTPDLCGGTQADPGQCNKFMCDIWLQGATVPHYEWNTETINESSVSAIRAAASAPGGPSIDALLRDTIAAHFRGLTVAVPRAAQVTNVYSANGYPALAVGCAGVEGSCSGSQQPTASSSDQLPPIIGGAVAGAFLLTLAGFYIVKRQRRTATFSGQSEGAALIGVDKSMVYTNL